MTDEEVTVERGPVDPGALIRSRQYRVILVFAAIVGVVVSLAAWAFLELVHGIQVGVYSDLPGDLGFDAVPWWWPLPWLAIAGLLTAIAITRLPGSGGHVPANGLGGGGGPTQPIELPGVLVAAVATLGFGLVLGPEAPLIALGMGLGVLAVRRAKRDAPEELVMVMAAAGSFAAISTVFGSPVIGAVILIEAAGLGGARLPVVLLPGLIAAGLGSLVFIGLGAWTGAEHERVDAEPDRSADVHAADRRPLLLGGGAGDRCGRRGVRDRRARAGRGARRGTPHGAADHHRRAARRRARGRL